MTRWNLAIFDSMHNVTTQITFICAQTLRTCTNKLLKMYLFDALMQALGE